MRLLATATLVFAVATTSATAAPARRPTTNPAAVKGAPAPSQTGYYPRPFDFKGIPMGVSLQEFKAMPFPEQLQPGQSSGKPIEVVCSESIPSNTKIIDPYGEIAPFGEEKDLPIIKCGYYTQQNYGPSEQALSLGGGPNWVPTYSFNFIEDPSDHVHRLFRIELITGDHAYSDVLDALKSKFGPPSSEKRDNIQNKAGSTFPRITQEWSNPQSSITLTSPGGGRIDQIDVLYLDKRLAARALSLLDAKRAAIKNRM